MQVYGTNISESINSLSGGLITSNAAELIMHTFSGKVGTEATVHEQLQQASAT
jgi:hypothetical protein